MDSILRIVAILILLLVLVKGTSQKLIHLTFKPTSYTLMDTTWAYEQRDQDED